MVNSYECGHPNQGAPYKRVCKKHDCTEMLNMKTYKAKCIH
jgi:hypothetical protein